MFQNITQIVKNKLFFYDFKRRKTMALCCSKKTISIIKRINYLNCLHCFPAEKSLNKKLA